MRTLLGTHIGVSAFYTLCSMAKCQEKRDPHVTRGCVYFLHMALWSSAPVTSLEVPYTFALPVLIQVGLG